MHEGHLTGAGDTVRNGEPVAWLRTSGAGSPVITEDFLKCYPTHRADFQTPLYALDIEVLRTVWRELDGGNGDGPDHDHAEPGIWDDGNGKLSGQPCKWCATWRKFTAIVRDTGRKGGA